MAQPSTVVALSMGKADLQVAATEVLEHLMAYPPEQPTVEYNIGVSILFEVLKHTFSMEDA